MNPQALMDGLVAGSMIGLGAVGVTLTYSILRFANFAHGEFISWGAYFALVVAGALGMLFGGFSAPIGPFSFGWGLIWRSGWTRCSWADFARRRATSSSW